jgi:type IV secretory pathway VirB6-like protein
MDTAILKKLMTWCASGFRHTGRPGRRRFVLGVFTLFALSFFFTSEAYAIFADTGQFTFDCQNGAAVFDQTRDIGTCTAAEAQGMISFTLCNFESIMLEAMARIDCTMAYQLSGPIKGFIAIYLSVLGVCFLTGMLNLTSKEAAVAIFKVGLVLVFVTSAPTAFKYGYWFFAGFAKEGSALVLRAVSNHAPAATNQANQSIEAQLTAPDKVMNSLTNYATGSGGGDDTIPMFANMPEACYNLLMVLLGVAVALIPPLSLFFIYALIKLLWLFARACLGYLSALFLITFLFILGPIFISFALFSSTRSLFDRWIQYLITYSLQMVIVFAFFALIGLFDFSGFFTQLGSLVKVDHSLAGGLGFLSYIPFLKIAPCSLCDMQIAAPGPTPPLGCEADAISCVSCKEGASVLPLFDILRHTDFITWVIVKFISLIIIMQVLEDFLKRAPELARNLGTARYAGVLGGDGPPGSVNLSFAGMNALRTGGHAFFSGWMNRSSFLPNRNLRAGIGAGITAAVFGETSRHYHTAVNKLRSQREATASLYRQSRIHTLVAYDVLASKLDYKRQAKATDAEVIFAQTVYSGMRRVEQRRRRKLQEIDNRLQDLTVNRDRYLSGAGILQEMHSNKTVTSAQEAGEAMELQEQQKWYNLLPGKTDMRPEELEKQRLQDLKNYATDVVRNVRNTQKYKDLSPFDQHVLDRNISLLENALTYNNADEIMDLVHAVTQEARNLSITL